MKDFIITFLKVYSIGFGTILVLLFSLAYDNIPNIDGIHIATVVVGTALSTAFLVYLSVKEDNK